MKGRILFVTYREGGKVVYLDQDRYYITKDMIMKLPIKDKYPSVAWGGWIHSFMCIRSWYHDQSGRLCILLARYDAYNDGIS